MDHNNPEPEIPTTPVPTVKDLRDLEVYLYGIPNEEGFDKAPRPEDANFLAWAAPDGNPEKNIALDTRMAHWDPEKGKFVINVAVAIPGNTDTWNNTPEYFEGLLKQRLAEFQDQYDLLEINYLGMVDGSSVVQESKGVFSYDNTKSLNMKGDILYFVPYIEPLNTQSSIGGFADNGIYNSPDGSRRYIGINIEEFAGQFGRTDGDFQSTITHEFLHSMFFLDHPFKDSKNPYNSLVISPELYQGYNTVMDYAAWGNNPPDTLGILDTFKLEWLDGQNEFLGDTDEQLSDSSNKPNIISELPDSDGGKDTLIVPSGCWANISFDPRYVGSINSAALYFPPNENNIEYAELSDFPGSVILGPTDGLNAPYRTISLGKGPNNVPSGVTIEKNIIIPANGDTGDHLIINPSNRNESSVIYRAGTNLEGLHAEVDPNSPRNIILINDAGDKIILKDQMLAGRGVKTLLVGEVRIDLDQYKLPESNLAKLDKDDLEAYERELVTKLNSSIQNGLEVYKNGKEIQKQGSSFGLVDNIGSILQANPDLKTKLPELETSLSDPNAVLTTEHFKMIRILYPENEDLKNLPSTKDKLLRSKDVFDVLPLKDTLALIGRTGLVENSEALSNVVIKPEDMVWLMECTRLTLDTESGQQAVGSVLAEMITFKNPDSEKSAYTVNANTSRPNVEDFLKTLHDGNNLYAYNSSLRLVGADWASIMSNIEKPITLGELISYFDNNTDPNIPGFSEIVGNGLQEFNNWQTYEPTEISGILHNTDINNITNTTIFSKGSKSTKLTAI